MARRPRPPKDWRPKLPKPRKSRAKYSKRFAAAVKRIRHGLAILKRKKVISKATNVRGALPSKKTRAIVKRNEAVVKGEATTWKLPDDVPQEIVRALKAQGYKIRGKGKERRVTLQKTQYLRKAKVYERPTESRPGYHVEPQGGEGPLTEQAIEQRIKRAFHNQKPGDAVAFEVGDGQGRGGKSYSIYYGPDSMLKDLMRYRTKQDAFEFTRLVVFRISKAKQKAYIADSLSRRERSRPVSSAYRQVTRRTNNRGIRASRGH